MRHIIDLDADPFVPDGLSYYKKDQLPKRARGEFVWDSTKVNFYFSLKQNVGTGYDLCDELKRDKYAVLGRNVLDYLLKHPKLIPDSWEKGSPIFFLGTIYRSNTNGHLLAPYMCRNDGRWISGLGYFFYIWVGSSSAILIIS